MNVFVLSTGRCGSTTIARAFSHATNFTVGHETRARDIAGRLDYPPNHIESDNRLTWFLASLGERYATGTHWIHLTRRHDVVVESYWQRWEGSIRRYRTTNLLRHPRLLYNLARDWRNDPSSVVRGSIASTFGYGVVMSAQPLTTTERRAACDLYVRTANDTITQFLSTRTNVSHIALETAREDFTETWSAIGAEGPIDAALAELEVRHNARRAR